YQPLAPEDLGMPYGFNDSSARDGSSAGDNRFVEYTGRISQDQEHTAADITPNAQAKSADQTRCYGGHDGHSSHSRRNQEGQEKIRQDQRQEQALVAGPDAQRHQVSQ